MSLLFADGFGHYNVLAQKWTYAQGAEITPAAKRGTGVAGCAFIPGEGYLLKSLPYLAGWTVGGAWMLNTGEGFSPSGALYQLATPTLGGGSVELMTLFVEADYSISIYAGSQTGSLAGNTGIGIGGSSFYLVNGVWFYIEVQFTLGGASITATLNVNGTTYLNMVEATGSSNPISWVSQGAGADMHLLSGAGGGSGSVTYFADFYINDSTGTGTASGFRGDIQVGPGIYPVSDLSTAWAESSGGPPSYPLVSEVPPDGDTTYVYDYNLGDVDDFILTTVLSLVGEIQAVHLCLFMRKDNEGSRGVGPQVGGNTLTPTANLSDSYYYFTYPMDANPGGSGTWTVSSVNSTAFGVEIVS